MEEGRLHKPLPHITKGPKETFVWNIFIKDMNKLKSDPTTKNMEEVFAKHFARADEEWMNSILNLPKQS